MKQFILIFTALASLASCKQKPIENPVDMQKKVNQFADFTLASNIDDLSNNDKELLKIMFEISEIMDDMYWEQAFGCKEEALKLAKGDSLSQRFIEINYGPWERLNDNKPFIAGVMEKPLGANFYPVDMTKPEFDSLKSADKASLYTMIRRDDKGKLITVPYRTYFKNNIEKAAGLLKEAAKLADDAGLKKYLELRSEALLTDNYLPSDLAWMDMKTNRIDFVVGPVETYEDQIYGYKASFEAYILLKDMEWSKKLAKFAALLPELQKRLPVEQKYKTEVPGSSSDLGAYDVVYYAGDCNAGSKTIAINLPNDPEVLKQKGSRRLQLKNAMKAKFDKILVPISKELITPNQQSFINFDAFFENTMFHEVAHGIGVHHVVGDTTTVSDAMKDKAGMLEEDKADILGLFLVDELLRMKELNSDYRCGYTTFAAGIFRSIRFGTASAHGNANLITYNYFREKGAFTRDANGIYTVNYDSMKIAITSLARDLIMVQGNGDYSAASKFIEKYSILPDDLESDLERINSNDIPVDIVFNQGPEFLGLKACKPENCKETKKCPYHN
jgi:hypothetical protein